MSQMRKLRLCRGKGPPPRFCSSASWHPPCSTRPLFRPGHGSGTLWDSGCGPGTGKGKGQAGPGVPGLGSWE